MPGTQQVLMGFFYFSNYVKGRNWSSTNQYAIVAVSKEGLSQPPCSALNMPFIWRPVRLTQRNVPQLCIYFFSSCSSLSPEIPIRQMFKLLSAPILCCSLEELHSSIFLITNLTLSCVYFDYQSIYVKILNITIQVKTQRFLANPFIKISYELTSLFPLKMYYFWP